MKQRDSKSQMYVLFCYFEYMSINSLHLCLRLLCRLLHCCKPLSANLHLTWFQVQVVVRCLCLTVVSNSVINYPQRLIYDRLCMCDVKT